MKHIIRSIDPGSPLSGKLRPGDELLAINGHAIRDVLDYKYYSYETRLSLEVRTPEGKLGKVRLKKDLGGDAGLSFETYLMDAPRSCANRCIFCFVDQMPPGLRKSLYFKDDDARLSFLMGCYITLTNLSEREVRRIIDLRISPINVSVHTADPALRCRMLGHPRAGESLSILGRFAAAGIKMNCQIVCCPGWNDGGELEKTMRAMRGLYPAVRSVAVVPVGLTKYREGLAHIEPFSPALAAETVRRVAAFGDACLRETGERVFFCADELYLRAGEPLPPDGFYEDYPQLENGVGMLRLLETEFRLALSASEGADGVPFSIACGEDAAPLLEKLVRAAGEIFGEIQAAVYPIRNDFFGPGVTVTGLLTGRDIIAQLQGRELGRRLLICRSMLRRDECDFLDSVTLDEASGALGVPIYPIEQDGAALCDAMLGILPEIPRPKADAEDTAYNKYKEL